MGTQRTTFDKLQRERAKKARAAAKRARRQARGEESDEQPPEAPVAEALSAAELLDRIEDVHRRFEAKAISFEDFEAEKTELFERLASLPIE